MFRLKLVKKRKFELRRRHLGRVAYKSVGRSVSGSRGGTVTRQGSSPALRPEELFSFSLFLLFVVYVVVCLF